MAEFIWLASTAICLFALVKQIGSFGFEAWCWRTISASAGVVVLAVIYAQLQLPHLLLRELVGGLIAIGSIVWFALGFLELIRPSRRSS